MQLVAKALVSGIVGLVIALAASAPAASAGVEAQARLTERNVCILLASAASSAASSGNQSTVSVYSPTPMNVSVENGRLRCTSGGPGFSIQLLLPSSPYLASFEGERNFTVAGWDGILHWW